MPAASPADWAAFFCLGTSITAAASIPVLLFADAKPSDFDPRRLLNTDAGARLLVEVTRAKGTASEATRDTALTAAALLALLTPSPEVTR
ncbi:hypothetical protein ACFVAF_37075 [Streptomyces sp. NPDC057596]|uniref:hypothetical protein n=1 Tax=Streptomyces sp. NPDC057596 TaxID=3346178 RepID=UPI0036CC35CF